MLDAFKTNGDSPPQSADFRLLSGGTVYLLRPMTRAACARVDGYLPADVMWFGGAIVVEHRYAGQITSDGLTVR